MLVCGQAVILVPSPAPFPPIFLHFLNLFNMAQEIEFALSDFPSSHKTASYAGKLDVAHFIPSAYSNNQTAAPKVGKTISH